MKVNISQQDSIFFLNIVSALPVLMFHAGILPALPQRYQVLSRSCLQVSTALQVKQALVYFANFHKHTKTHRAHLHARSCTPAQTRRQTFTEYCNIQA